MPALPVDSAAPASGFHAKSAQMEDGADDAKFPGEKDGAFELTGLELRTIDETTIEICFKAKEAIPVDGSRYGWFAIYLDLDNSPETGFPLRGSGCDIILGIEPPRGAGPWAGVCHPKSSIGQEFPFETTLAEVNGKTAVLRIKSEAFRKYPLFRYVVTSKAQEAFVDWIPDEGFNMAKLFPVTDSADKQAMENLFDESFIMDIENGHYDRHAVVIPPGSSSVEVTYRILEEHTSPEWTSVCTLYLAADMEHDLAFTKAYFCLKHEKYEIKFKGSGKSELLKEPPVAVEKGKPFVFSYQWGPSGVASFIDGKKLLNDPGRMDPKLAIISVSGAKVKIEKIEFK